MSNEQAKGFLESTGASQAQDGDSIRQHGHALRLNSFLLTLVAVLAIGLPIAFGGMADWALPAALSLSAVALLTGSVLHSTSLTGPLFRPKSLSSRFLAGFAAVACLVALQTAWLRVQLSSHPVLTTATSMPSPGLLSPAAQMLIFFLFSFALVRACADTGEQRNRIFKIFIAAGLVLSLIALSHWFYDTGKLFWSFEPHNIFTSNRARWPFVNSNHLGHALLPIYFVLLAGITVHLQTIRKRAQEYSGRSWRLLLSSQRIQSHAIQLALNCACLIASILCIVATLSRSTWLGLAFGSLIFVVLRRSLHAQERTAQTPPAADAVVDLAQLRQKRRHSRHEKTSWSELIAKFGPVALVLLAIALLVLFLVGRGSELVSSRIEYGLTASKDDLRWQLYGDSLSLIQQHPVLGVGLGGWERSFFTVTTESLTGLRPEFLHSDPLQFLIEAGVPIFAFTFCLCVALTVSLLRAVPHLQSKSDAVNLCGLIAAMLAMLVASGLDFPFRIPAIVFYFAACLATAVAIVDESISNRSKTGS